VPGRLQRIQPEIVSGNERDVSRVARVVERSLAHLFCEIILCDHSLMAAARAGSPQPGLNGLRTRLG
jgi:hypothetical protein